MPIRLKVEFRARDFRQLQRGLNRLRMPAARRVYERSLRASGELLRDVIQNEFLSGQSVRVRKGLLRRSITLDTRGLRQPRPFVDVGSDRAVARYAGPHEFGWPGKNIPARPFVQPALVRIEPRLPGLWVREIDRELRRAGAS